MSREGAFLVWCMERYRHAKALSGREVAALFRENGVYDYILRFYGALHTLSDTLVVEDIDAHLAARSGS